MWSESLVAESNTAFAQVVRRHLYTHLVAGKNLDVVHAHLSGDMGGDFVTVFQHYTKHSVGKGFNDSAVLFDCRLFSHIKFLWLLRDYVGVRVEWTPAPEGWCGGSGVR